MKFHWNISNGYQVIERTRFVMDRQTDGWTDRRMDARVQTICLQIQGGDISNTDDLV